MSTDRIREKTYLAYLDFLETAESKRDWSIWDDIPWDKLDASPGTESKAALVEGFCAEEMYVPDYSSKGIGFVRTEFGQAWFQTRWSYEESRHGLVLREYLTRSGLRTEAQFGDFEKDLFSRSWDLPFGTQRQMQCYGAIQEAATYYGYKVQRDRARAEGDHVLDAIFHLIARDEAAHAGFYRRMVELELEEDRQGTLRDLALVISQFRMPGDGLIPNYRQRNIDNGIMMTHKEFFRNILIPTLKSIGTTRAELKAEFQADAATPSDAS